MDLRFTKGDFSSLISRLWRFKDNLCFLLLHFGLWTAGWAGVLLLLDLALSHFGIEKSSFVILYKVITSVLPLAPTLTIWKCRDDFGGSMKITDGIMDACFGIWISIIIMLWI